MRMRALLALLVLLGMLPVQGGIGADSGRAENGPTVLFLDTSGGAQNLSVAEPPGIGSVILNGTGSAEFVLASFSGLRNFTGAGTRDIWLNLTLVSLNTSGIRLHSSIIMDFNGNGTGVKEYPFPYFDTTVAMEAEHVLLGFTVNATQVQDFRRGSIRVNLSRNDTDIGLLEVLCGSGADASTLIVPYGAPLVADAGPDRSAKVNATVMFNASLSGSVDPAGTEYLWNFGNGMTGAGAIAGAAYIRPGAYNVTLTMRWNDFESNDTAVVTVSENLPPVADIAGTNITKRAGEAITFRGGGYDPDGTIAGWNWSFGDGNRTSGRNVTHSYAVPGDYNVTLTVTDDGGAASADSINVHINLPPVVHNITASRSGAVWSFQVAVIDPDGTNLRYNWSFGDGASSNSSRPTHTYSAVGTYTVRCVITDSYDDTGAASLNITVSNAPPVISALGISGTDVAVNDPVRFRPSVYDPDGDTLVFSWTFGDGTTSTDRNPTHYYRSAGTYTVTLRVNDGTAVVTRTGTVTVSESGGGVDSTLLGLLPCILTFVILVIIVIARSAAAARKRREQELGGQYQPYGGPSSAPQTYGYQHPQYGGGYQPYGAGYPPVPPRANRPPKAPAGVCPRCGSQDLQRFPDGHAKCQNCKKIFFTG